MSDEPKPPASAGYAQQVLAEIDRRVEEGEMTRPEGRWDTTLSLYVIYRSPKDYPGLCVLRRWEVGAGAGRPAEVIAVAPDLGEVRLALSPGLLMLPRDPADDPVIVESWI